MIELSNVNKQYGQATVLKNINLRIGEPGIYCLLGRNGVGKTTLLKSIAGYQNISDGEIRVDGKEITTATLDTGVSYIENLSKHFNLPVRKLLSIAGEVNPSYDFDFAFEMMDRFELDGKKKFNNLSFGMKTMVSTIICLASNKKVILLDEPVIGFDAIMRAEFYDMLVESYKKHPRIIIVSTHIIDEIEKTIEKLIIIDKGAIRFFDTLKAVETEANSLGIQQLSLQDFFIQMVRHKGGDTK
ncbi:ABC transporter ATP-binding protein [Romboutsia weinsteinii]|uniref:ABC transporter ATP-binding protein n=1 Tax=Romboutsia weinsteinii TaxID=2020949 RepID=A0A371J1P3_9FIRM|nr:ABC transporter ATP-binding protein [Romboutsia weinsteinii]RDY26731.1 ABC transporter ATP-binding protein [Romboutsia weinsteinii]